MGTNAFGSNLEHDLALGAVHYSRVLSDVIGKDYWYRGNAELVYELFGGLQLDPTDRVVVGLIPLLRYNFATGSPWVPFVNGGVGIAYTDISEPDLNGGFEFIIQVGAGAHYFFREDRALTWQYRFFHLSNGDLSSPNQGVNTNLFFLGWTRFF